MEEKTPKEWACSIAGAERFLTRCLLSFNERHFRAWRHGRAVPFEFLPADI